MSQYSPDGASLGQRQSFQTELLEFIMDIIYMLSNEEENSTHLNSQGRITMHAFPHRSNCKTCTKKEKKSLLQMCRFLFDLSGCPQSESPEGQMGTLMENVLLFSKMLLQKLYSGMFLGDPESLLNFLADQIVVVR